MGGLSDFGRIFSLSQTFNSGNGLSLGGINRDLRNANRGLRTADRVGRQLERGQGGRALRTLGGEVKRQGRSIDLHNRREWNAAKGELVKEFRAGARDIRYEINNEFRHRKNDLQQAHRAERAGLRQKFTNGEMDKFEYKEALIDLKHEQRQDMRGLNQEKQATIRGMTGRDAMQDYIESRIGPKPGQSELTQTGETLRGIGQILTTLDRMSR